MRGQRGPGEICEVNAQNETVNSHTIAVLVDNEPGVLARVIGLFSGRGYNIESLTVAKTDNVNNMSRITIVTTGTPESLSQHGCWTGQALALRFDSRGTPAGEA